MNTYAYLIVQHLAHVYLYERVYAMGDYKVVLAPTGVARVLIGFLEGMARMVQS